MDVQFFAVSILLIYCNLIDLVDSHTEHPLLLLVSFDGFRWDYLHKVKCLKGRKTPHFDELIENGVFVQNGVKNAYITKTFPNHYSIVTGLYEESHGVIANSMYDPLYKKKFDITTNSTEDPFWFDNGALNYSGYPEPIWLTNEKVGSKHPRRSGVMFWPGSEAKTMTAYHYMKYDSSIPNKTRIDNVVNWFSTEDNPINLGLLYFSEPDHTGHEVGPDSERMIDLIVALDDLVGYLIQTLQNANLLSRMNIIITSDHGMAEVKDAIELDSFVDPSLYEQISGGPVWNILPKEGQEDELYHQLKTVKNLTVYKKDDIPKHYHYKNNRRVMPIVIEAAPNFMICHNKSQGCSDKGTHGYDNGLSSMHPIFIGHGPAFKNNYTSSQFNNVDIYELMCHILKVKPAPNNGSFDNIKQVLYIEEGLTLTSITLMGSIVFSALISGVCCVATSRLYLRKRPRRQHSQAMGLLGNGRKEQESPLLSSSEEEFA